MEKQFFLLFSFFSVSRGPSRIPADLMLKNSGVAFI